MACDQSSSPTTLPLPRCCDLVVGALKVIVMSIPDQAIKPGVILLRRSGGLGRRRQFRILEEVKRQRQASLLCTRLSILGYSRCNKSPAHLKRPFSDAVDRVRKDSPII